MRKFALLAMMVICLSLSGCMSQPIPVSTSPPAPNAWEAVKVQAAGLVTQADALAVQNDAIVEKLILQPGTATEDEKVTAIRNARVMAILTGALKKVMGGN